MSAPLALPVRCIGCADDLDGLPWWLQILTIGVGVLVAYGVIWLLARLIGRPKRPAPPAVYRTILVNREQFYSLLVEEGAGRYWVTIPVRLSATVESEEAYQVDRGTFERFRVDPAAALAFVTRARNRELDHLLRELPPAHRGTPW